MFLSWMFVMLLRFTAGLLFWIFTFGVIGIIAYGRYPPILKSPNIKIIFFFSVAIVNNQKAFYFE